MSAELTARVEQARSLAALGPAWRGGTEASTGSRGAKASSRAKRSGVDDAFTRYAPSERFVEGQLVDHSKFGKGVVLVVDGSRVEIAFAEGRKKVAHGMA
jgi:hypothetical protein